MYAHANFGPGWKEKYKMTLKKSKLANVTAGGKKLFAQSGGKVKKQ